MSDLKTAEHHAVHDLVTVKEFRVELGKHRPIFKTRLDITASQSRMTAERERQEYATRQNSIVASLATYEPLYTWRMELCRTGDQMRIYFSPIGAEFSPVVTDDGDDVLVSWAHPDFLDIRNLTLGGSAQLARGKPANWTLVSKTEVGREDRDLALFDLKVTGRGIKEALFQVVRFEGGVPVAILAGSDSDSATIDSARAGDGIAQAFGDLFREAGEVEQEGLEKKPRLVLDTIVRNKDGRAVAIPFALDEPQWEALRRYAGEGTLLMTGPPGTGKTTVALLRATTLIHSTYDYDEQGQRTSDRPKVDLRKQRFRVVVVTEHLRSYLKEFLASPEVGLAEAQVVNLRGAFLETFVRHKTLSTWIRGLRFRLSKQKNRLSDALIYVKSLPETLRLCFYHAVLNAQEHAGADCQTLIQKIFDRVYDTIEKAALERTLSEGARDELQKEELAEAFDLDGFLVRHRQKEAFDAYVDPRIADVQLALVQLRSFANSWLRSALARCDESIGATEETWLVPGGDDLLLSRFVESVSALDGRARERSLFFREAWRAMVHLVDPKEVLLRVISDFEETGDMQSLYDAGLTRDDALNSLREWREVLEGTGTPEVDEGETEVEDDGGTLDDLEMEGPNDGGDLARRKGSLTRTDFPLLAAMARVFLALPPEAKQSPETYRGVGFLLPDDLPRYDHVIIDEGQDFTYAEIHLVRSLVEMERQAVTVSGDPFQRMDWRCGFSSLETIPAAAERRFHITRNYRQTIELANWVRHLASVLYGDPRLVIESAHEHGPQAQIIVEPSLGNVVRVASESLRDWYLDDRNPFASMLLIGFNDGTMSKIANSLSDALEEHAIHAEKVQDGRQIERGSVSVATVPTVKGLEFDGVVVVVSKEGCGLLGKDTPQARITKNMLYVACSRAKRNLTIILQEDVERLRLPGVY